MPGTEHPSANVEFGMKPHFSPRTIVAVVLGVALVAGACGSETVVVAGEPTEEATVEPTTEPEPTAERTATPDTDPADIDDAALAELEAARARWEAAGLADYSYTYSRSCECAEEEWGPNTVVVVNAVSVEVRGPFGDPVDATDETVEGLFAAIEQSIRSGQRVANRYDPDLGHPTEVSLDLEAQEVDGGFRMTITGFLATGTLRAELAEARARWEANGPINYAMTYQITCFCPELKTTVVVDGGVIVADESDGDVEVPLFTVEDLFAEIQDALDSGAAGVFARYDPETGYPVEHFIDEQLMMADEEHGVVVELFEAL